MIGEKNVVTIKPKIVSKERPQFRLERYSYTARTTIGRLFAWNYALKYYEFFCYTLEDTVRAYGIKVYGETAVPATNPGQPYNVTTRVSPKFGEVGVFYTDREGDKFWVKNGGIRFMYNLLHGGNKHGNTKSCILVAKNYIDKDTIQGSYMDEMFKKINEYAMTCEVFLEIVNLPQEK